MCARQVQPCPHQASAKLDDIADQQRRAHKRDQAHAVFHPGFNAPADDGLRPAFPFQHAKDRVDARGDHRFGHHRIA